MAENRNQKEGRTVQDVKPFTPEQNLTSALNQVYYGAPAVDYSQQAGSQVAGVYAPVLADLTAQQNAAKKRTSQNDAALAAMYAALQGSIKNNGYDIQRQTDANVAHVNQQGDQAKQSIESTYSGMNNDLASILQQIGGGAAAGAAFDKANANRGLIEGILANNQSSAANLASQLGANAANFNTAQSNIAGFAGNDARANNKRTLEDTLAGIGSKTADIRSQQASQALQLRQSLQNQALQQMQTQANQLIQSYQAQQDAAVKQQELGMKNLTTGDRAYSQAAALFGVNGDAASRAVNMIMDAGASQQPTTAMDLVRSVLQKNNELKATNPSQALPDDQLTNLAMSLYAELKPAAPNYMQSYLMQQG